MAWYLWLNMWFEYIPFINTCLDAFAWIQKYTRTRIRSYAPLLTRQRSQHPPLISAVFFSSTGKSSLPKCSSGSKKVERLHETFFLLDWKDRTQDSPDLPFRWIISCVAFFLQPRRSMNSSLSWKQRVIISNSIPFKILTKQFNTH